MIEPGRYKHYKGKEYEVLFVAKHSESLEELVIYKALYDNSIWARPVQMFLENVEVNGTVIPRFTKID